MVGANIIYNAYGLKKARAINYTTGVSQHYRGFVSGIKVRQRRSELFSLKEHL